MRLRVPADGAMHVAAVLALALTWLPASLHTGEPHGETPGTVVQASSSCQQQHAPRFERCLETRERACLGCLLQLSQTGDLGAVSPGVPGGDPSKVEAPRRAAAGSPHRHSSSPRGPPRRGA
jgi:hypothetical protein